jgi:hypothetical protein
LAVFLFVEEGMGRVRKRLFWLGLRDGEGGGEEEEEGEKKGLGKRCRREEGERKGNDKGKEGGRERRKREVWWEGKGEGCLPEAWRICPPCEPKVALQHQHRPPSRE